LPLGEGAVGLPGVCQHPGRGKEDCSITTRRKVPFSGGEDPCFAGQDEKGCREGFPCSLRKKGGSCGSWCTGGGEEKIKGGGEREPSRNFLRGEIVSTQLYPGGGGECYRSSKLLGGGEKEGRQPFSGRGGGKTVPILLGEKKLREKRMSPEAGGKRRDISYAEMFPLIYEGGNYSKRNGEKRELARERPP